MRLHVKKILIYLFVGVCTAAVFVTIGYLIAQVFFYEFALKNTEDPVLETQEKTEQLKVAEIPKVSFIESPDLITEGDVVSITFTTEMNPDFTSIDTDIDDAGVWKSGSVYELTASNVVPDKTYSILIKKGSRSKEGGEFEEDTGREIKSASRVTSRIYVDVSEHGIKEPIKVTFNQAVNHESAEDAFSTSPNVKGSFSWKGQTMIFTPNKLQYQTQYTISLSKGISSEKGFESNESIKVSFQSEAEIYKLKVPYFKQQYMNSCEAASLRMALAYYGITTDDMEIVKKFGYNPRYKDTATNSWDDPREMFVGFVDVLGSNSGYGVYGPPVEKAAKQFGRDAQFKNVVTPRYIAEEIKAGHPVILWGFTSTREPPYTWNVPRGGTVAAFKGEHARLVVGVKGSVSNPLGFYVHDPINGNQYQYWETNKLMRQALYLPGVTDQVVVVK